MSYTFDMLNEMSKVYTIRLQRYTDYKFKFVPRPLFLRRREKKCEFEPVKCTIRVKVIYQGGRGEGIYKHNFCPNSFLFMSGTIKDLLLKKI